MFFKNLNRDKCLLVAGGVKKGNEDYLNEIINAAGDSDNIFIINKIIPDREVPYFINSADFMLFNFTEILTSGSVHLALSYNKPIIIPKLGCLNELKGEKIFCFDAGTDRIKNLKDLLLRL